MFTPERKTKKLTESNSISIGKNTFKTALLEAGIDFSETMSKFNLVIESSLQDSNQVYNEHVQTNLKDFSLESLNRSVSIFEMTIDILSAFKNIIVGEIAQFKNINKRVIETYEPLLKKLDRHKYGYQIPEYDFDNLEPDDIFTRVTDLLSKKFNLNLFGQGAIGCDEVENSINKFKKNSSEYYEDLKRVVLGVPNSASIDDFDEVVRSFFVKQNNLQMKRIGDDLFSNLRAAGLGIESIDNVIALIQKEIFNIYAHKATIENNSGNEYINSVYANAIVIRANLLGACLTYIEDIIKIKISIFEEMCINHRKVIIDGYEKISKDPESHEGIYLPNNDPTIAEQHSEYLSGHWVDTLK